MKAKRFLTCLAITSALTPQSKAEELPASTKNAISLLEFAGASGSVLYHAAAADGLQRMPGDRYERLARRVAAEMHAGQAASLAAKAPFDLAAGLLTTAAVVDQEPLTRSAAAVGAFAAKKFGEAAGDAILSQTKDTVVSLLARGLKESTYTPEQLQSMSKDKFLATVESFSVGNEKMADILKDVPAAKEELRRSAEEFHRTQTVAVLAAAIELKGEVADVKNKVQSVYEGVRRFAEETGKQLGRVESSLNTLKAQAEQQAKDIQDLQESVKGNGAAIRSLAYVSSMSWTTEQKLAALDAGLLPDISGASAEKMRKSLQAQIRTEKTLTQLQDIAQGLGNIATIATNLGVNPQIVKAAQAGQIVATAIAQFTVGGPMGYLSGASTLSALAGLGRSGQDSNAALQGYLQQQFDVINGKLDKILELQGLTLQALAGVSEQLARMERQLNTLEYMSTINNASLQTLLNEKWDGCEAVLGEINYARSISTLQQLLKPLSSGTGRSNLQECYRNYQRVFLSDVGRGEWGGPRFGLIELPQRDNGSNLQPAEAEPYLRRAQKMRSEYLATRAFFLEKYSNIPEGGLASAPAWHLAALLEPQATLFGLKAKMDRLEAARDQLQMYRCGDSATLNPGIGEPLCAGSTRGSTPRPDRWSQILNESLAGPQAVRVIDLGMPFVTWLDFAYESDSKQQDLKFVSVDELIAFPQKGLSASITRANEQRLGGNMLRWLSWLNHGYLLQYSLAYGDYTAYSVVDALFDPTKKALVKRVLSGAPSPQEMREGTLQDLALRAIKENDLLARNVVLVALDRALRAQGVLQVSAFAHAISGFRREDGCRQTAASLAYLTALLPNWKFELRLPSEVKTGGKTSCASVPDEGRMPAGIGVVVDGHFIRAPSPEQLRQGLLEQPPALRVAISQRARLTEIGILRNARSWFPTFASVDDQRVAAELLSSQCLTGNCVTPTSDIQSKRAR